MGDPSSHPALKPERVPWSALDLEVPDSRWPSLLPASLYHLRPPPRLAGALLSQGPDIWGERAPNLPISHSKEAVVTRAWGGRRLHRSYQTVTTRSLKPWDTELPSWVLASQGLSWATWGLPTPSSSEDRGCGRELGCGKGGLSTRPDVHMCVPVHTDVQGLLKWGFIRQWGVRSWESGPQSRWAALRQGGPQENGLRPSLGRGEGAPDMSQA